MVASVSPQGEACPPAPDVSRVPGPSPSLTNLGLLLHLWEEGATPQGLVTLGVFSLNLINLKEEFCFHVCRLVSRLLGTRRFGGAGRLGHTGRGPHGAPWSREMSGLWVGTWASGFREKYGQGGGNRPGGRLWEARPTQDLRLHLWHTGVPSDFKILFYLSLTDWLVG